MPYNSVTCDSSPTLIFSNHLSGAANSTIYMHDNMNDYMHMISLICFYIPKLDSSLGMYKLRHIPPPMPLRPLVSSLCRCTSNSMTQSTSAACTCLHVVIINHHMPQDSFLKLLEAAHILIPVPASSSNGAMIVYNAKWRRLWLLILRQTVGNLSQT